MASKRRDFDPWMRIVNTHLVVTCGLDSGDIPDFAYWDAWDAGCSPVDTANKALKAAEDF